jgi:hypothetical protein
MTAKPPTKTQNIPSDAGVKKTFDPFRPDMPQIPGVSRTPGKTKRASNGMGMEQWLRIAGIAAAVAVIGTAIFWWIKSKPAAPANSSSSAKVVEQPAPAPQASTPVSPVQKAINAAATVIELSKPWTAKTFIFVKPFTRENINAMVIRLPGGELWAFAIKEPYSHCDLEFVTDLAKLSSKYGYMAGHPMVANPCNSTLYDPLKLSTLEDKTWVRGAIAVGSGLRPPTAIEVKVSGNFIVADNIE